MYSEAEIAVTCASESVWTDVIIQTPNPLPSIVQTQALPEWERLRQAATATLAVFEVRGVFSQEIEI